MHTQGKDILKMILNSDSGNFQADRIVTELEWLAMTCWRDPLESPHPMEQEQDDEAR